MFFVYFINWGFNAGHHHGGCEHVGACAGMSLLDDDEPRSLCLDTSGCLLCIFVFYLCGARSDNEKTESLVIVFWLQSRVFPELVIVTSLLW